MRRGRHTERQRGGMSQQAVANALGLSRGRIMQIEHAALSKLRATLEAAGVDGPGEEPINWWGEAGGDDE